MKSNNLPSPFEGWRLSFYFDDKPEVFKYRPVVILDINSDTGEVLVAGAKVTSHPPRTDCPGEVAALERGWSAQAIGCSLHKDCPILS